MSLLEEGQTIRETYEVERFLGQGAFAEVYRVKHRFLGRQAMKIFKRAGMTIAEIEEMLGEAIMLSRIGHPNIVRVFDANVIETPRGLCGFFTMENVPGGSLEKFWHSYSNNSVPVETTVDLIKQVCRGIVDLLADTLNQWPQWLRIVATSRSYPEVLERLHKALGFKTRTETFEAIVFSWDCFKITKDRETRHDRSRAVSLG